MAEVVCIAKLSSYLGHSQMNKCSEIKKTKQTQKQMSVLCGTDGAVKKYKFQMILI